MKRKLFVCLLLFASALTAVHAQQAKFRADDSTKDIRVGAGLAFNVSDSDLAWKSPSFQMIYTRNFWSRLAYRVGIEYAPATDTYKALYAVPIGLSYRPYSEPLGRQMTRAAGNSILDVIGDSASGRSNEIGSDVLANLVVALFRRTEYFAGITPSYFSDGELFATADLGLSFTLPIWHIGIYVSPVYHYLLKDPFLVSNGTVSVAPFEHTRSVISVTAGLSYLF